MKNQKKTYISPTTQAVLDAFTEDDGLLHDWKHNHYNIDALAAALRAAVDQIVSEEPCGNDCCITQCEQIREDFLTIAAELESVE
jgi:hypothetical protein